MDQRRNNTKPVKIQEPINNFIRAREVLIIGDNGEKLGPISKLDGIRLAEERGLDLFQVGQQADGIAICKIVDYGKFKFQQQKKQKEVKKNQVKVENREVRLTVNIGQHDLLVKAKKAREFLEAGDRVKVSLKFRGREIAYMDQGMETINKFYLEIEDAAKIEKEAKLTSRFLDMYLVPKK
ncbi:translation initiation factor IF-3 [Entomoplasma ellychniae]|uniref:Translation initiation factor IF-3 n=1 Tax=Entomoplasma ellychniae TaxID=2114 RepID=A0A8E2UED4_9MOLU|nr:translation initiation factor IF-3 [Entomoplasma ellychniae]PPE04983.1 translation initiation factor IF-3 [Entomoplasma ellychniae]